jgi:hypothetical protein
MDQPGFYAAPAKPPRPIIATILAVLWLLGGLFGIYTAFTYFSLPKLNGGIQALAGVDMVVNVALIVAAVGLLMLKRWGWQLAIALLFISIALQVVEYFVLIPAVVDAVIANTPGAEILSAEQRASVLSQTMGTQTTTIFISAGFKLVIAAYLLMSKKVRNALT